MPKTLTDLERRVLDYLVDYLRTNTYQPSIREIGREFTIRSTKTVSELLQSLADKGWIERDPARSRGVRLIGVDMRASSVSIPFFDEIDNAPAAHYELDRQLAPGAGLFLFMQRGDHLADAAICSGDLLLIEPVHASEVESGDLALVGDGHAIAISARRCTRQGRDLLLEMAPSGDAPLKLTPQQASALVRGRVACVVRRLRPISPVA